MEVIHEGVLEIGVKPDSKSSKDWKTRLFVLKRYQQTERATLDYYKNTNKRWQKQSIKGVLSLWPHFEISIAHLCSYKYTLKLTTIEHTVYLAASSPAAMNKWYYFIQTQQVLTPTEDMYIFNIQARDSDAMNLIGAVGDCQLILTPEYQVKVVNLPKKEVLCVWPFDCLKTFSYGGGLFSFTAGRHSPHGPGDYSFITSQDKVIHQKLQKLIDKAKRYSTASSESSSFLSISERPPARLPLVNHRGGGREESSSGTSTSSSDENMPLPPSEYAEARDFSSQQRPSLPDGRPPKIPPKPPGSTISSDNNNPRTWLHERYGATQTENNSHLIEDRVGESDEDHVYSHTLHHPGLRHKSPVKEDPNIYNALVHQGLSKKPLLNYDVAYPKAKAQSVKGVGSETYSFIEQGKCEKPPIISSPPTTTLPLSPDGMTANPLYGSSGNLLEAIEANPLSPQLSTNNSEDPITKPLPPNEPLPSNPLPPNEPLPSNDSKPLSLNDHVAEPLPPIDSKPHLPNDPEPHSSSIDPLSYNPLVSDNGVPLSTDNTSKSTNARPDVTANPTYVTTSINNNSSGNSPSKTNSLPSASSDDTLLQDSAPKPLSEGGGGRSSGYSKISKPAIPNSSSDFVPSSVGSDFVPSSVGSDPPPLPEREYSFSDFEQSSPPV